VLLLIYTDAPPDATKGGVSFDVPLGNEAVGWGFLEYYTDLNRWFRMAVHEYDPSKRKPYQVSGCVTVCVFWWGTRGGGCVKSRA
jgi:hypothetical protein